MRTRCLCVVLGILLGAACSAGAMDLPASGPQSAPVAGPAADVQAVAQAGNTFACELYAKLRQQPGNLFLSPASVHTALGMTYAGAAGRTAGQMAAVLHFDLPADRLHAALGGLARELNHPATIRDKEPYRLIVSNALWMQTGVPFREEFTGLVKAHYEAGLNEVNFSPPEPARKIINDWVYKATQEKIEDLIPPDALSRDTVLVLTNAIYFKSTWDQRFDIKETQDDKFHLADGNSVIVPLMHQQVVVDYMETDEFQLVDLPYSGRVLSMTVLLPRARDGLEALEKQLSAEKLAEWLAQAELTRVDLYLPRFTFTSAFELGKALVALGMVDGFDGGKADFSAMTPETVSISKVLHQAFIAADEQGTEAGAATAVLILRGGTPPPAKMVFRATRPFVFLIRHRPTGAILFLGRVANPAAGRKANAEPAAPSRGAMF